MHVQLDDQEPRSRVLPHNWASQERVSEVIDALIISAAEKQAQGMAQDLAVAKSELEQVEQCVAVVDACVPAPSRTLAFVP